MIQIHTKISKVIIKCCILFLWRWYCKRITYKWRDYLGVRDTPLDDYYDLDDSCVLPNASPKEAFLAMNTSKKLFAPTCEKYTKYGI